MIIRIIIGACIVAIILLYILKLLMAFMKVNIKDDEKKVNINSKNNKKNGRSKKKTN
jgi:hypothetical protein